MDGVNDLIKMDDVILPGFRFHPTDEELVGFYLKRKIQHRALPIELIKQVDIYKYDPWDLPKLACSGEKEWYFYCPRDRKYRNSVRPNRVTVAGFWKATGTDRPIYSSNGNECIGLKKSLVFYRGRAAKGMKTDWMMHEFRLPSSPNPTSGTSPSKHNSDKSLPPNDSWAICRIFKKTNTMAQRGLSRSSWASQIHETNTASHHQVLNKGANCDLFSPETISCTTETGSPPIRLSIDHIPTYDKPMINPTLLKSYFPFASDQDHVAPKISNVSPVLSGDHNGKISERVSFERPQRPSNGIVPNLGMDYLYNNEIWGNMELVGFPFSLPNSNVAGNTWNPDFTWDSPLCPSDISATNFSTNQLDS